ncbi:MAG: NAD(P)/FAD-dependent oxidoreductase [Bacteroidia bacterium]
MSKPSLAIVGTGIAGMGCGYFLHNDFDLTVFETNDYAGGHTNTIAVNEKNRDVYFDTGFMVFNHQTYPLLTALFEELNVVTKPTSMSFSVQHVPSGLEYCGSGLNGLFAQRKNIFNPRYIRMLMQISRFNSESIKLLDDPNQSEISVADFCKKYNLGEDFLHRYLIPMSGAVWSTPPDKMLEFPALTLIRFFKNHGFLGLNTQHQWWTVEDGSRMYRDQIIAPYKNNIRLNDAVVSAKREYGKVKITTASGHVQIFDQVIFACHGNDALRLLSDASPLEQEVLSCFKYQANMATVHTDESIMPKSKRAWSSWNYRIIQQRGQITPSTIYWMNSLQGVSDRINYFVSIDEQGEVDPKKVIRKIQYEHPLFDVKAIAAQQKLPELNASGPIYFCGSYFRYGFHEDALLSAVNLCNQITGRIVLHPKYVQS